MSPRMSAVLAIGAVLTLAGCSSPVASKPTPTKTTSANATACQNFAALTTALPAKINAGRNEPLNALWESLRVEYDQVALTATGTVKERMLALSERWPDSFDVVLMHKFDGLNEKLQAVNRACVADGVAANIGILSDK